MLRLCDEGLSGDLTALEARIQRLEESVARGQVIRTAVEQNAAKPAPRKIPEKAPTTDMPPWEESAVTVAEELPPLPEEPPMMEEPGVRVFDVPEEFDRNEKKVEVKPEEPAQTVSMPAMSGNWWSALAETCKGRLSPMYRAFLDMCTGVLEDDQMTVYAPDDITLGRIDNDRVKGILAEEAAKAVGRPVRLVLRTGEPVQATPQENLQNLLKFGSQFDNIEIK